MSPRGKTILWVAALLGGVAIAVMLFTCDPERVAIYPVCPFHRLTGLDCPGCGSLRAMHQLLHGHFAMALRLNAMLVLSLPVFAWFGVRYLRRAAGAPIAPIQTRWIWVYLGVWMVFGVVRNLA